MYRCPTLSRVLITCEAGARDFTTGSTTSRRPADPPVPTASPLPFQRLISCLGATFFGFTDLFTRGTCTATFHCPDLGPVFLAAAELSLDSFSPKST